jgi:hypothetical protein
MLAVHDLRTFTGMFPEAVEKNNAAAEQREAVSRGEIPVLDPRLRRLDTLVDTLTYPDREQDKKDAEALLTDPTGFDKLLAKMTRKQKLQTDRSDPLLVELDAVGFTYDGWEWDKTCAEAHFVAHRVNLFHVVLARMKRKQMHKAGRLADPLLVELAAIVAGGLTFDDWPRHTAYQRSARG